MGLNTFKPSDGDGAGGGGEWVDPRGFTITALKVGARLEFAALIVRYKGAQTYGGLKCMVLRVPEEANKSVLDWLSKLRESGGLDPHFTEDGPVVARFAPTLEGWNEACKLAGAGMPTSRTKL